MRIFLLFLLMLSACSSVPIPKDPQECCKRLKIRNNTIKKFERLCIAMVFLEKRFEDDAHATKNIKDALRTCKYVYGIK